MRRNKEMPDLTKPIIFGFPQSTYVRTVRMTCAEKKVAYDLETIGFSSAGLAALHPFRRIPAFHHGDVALYETTAICRYIDAAFEGPALVPAAAPAAAAMEQWISVTNAYVDPPVIRSIVMERVTKPILGKNIDEDICAQAVPKARQALSVLNKRLSVSGYLAGDGVSLADFFLAPILYYFRRMPEGQEMMPDLAALEDWYGRMAARPSFEATVPPPPHTR